MCSGVVPQQPPTTLSPNSDANRVWASASSVGVSGYQGLPSRSSGSPALGRHDSGVRACWARYRRCSPISAGPVAQFIPITSTPRGSIAVRAAAMSDPSSIWPVVSTVTWVITGTRRPARSHARRTPRPRPT